MGVEICHILEKRIGKSGEEEAMIYSKECEYAIRALTYLARHRGKRCLAKEIANAEEMPLYFLSKILQTLTRQKLLSSAKGPNGGFQLLKAPEAISLYHIKKLIDGVEDLDECAVGLGRCNSQTPCPLHDEFKPLREKIKRYLQESTLSEMTRAVDRKKRIALKPKPQA